MGGARSPDRREVIEALRATAYGRIPPVEATARWELLEEGPADAIGVPGARRRQSALTVSGPGGSARAVVLAYLPPGAGRVPQRRAGRSGVPAFLALNFRGNHTLGEDPAVLVPGVDADAGPLHPMLEAGPGAPAPRGAMSRRWPLRRILEAGYALVTLCYRQWGPDDPAFPRVGLLPALDPPDRQGKRPADDAGAIAVWAWTLSRVLDGIRDGKVPGVDPARVCVLGHSRLGKTALWAAAQDERFAAAISNDSGAMGASLTRDVGETPEQLAREHPFWFSPLFSERALRGEVPSVDQDRLLAAIAPRPLYVASASGDEEADPEGEFLSLLAASPAWREDPGDGDGAGVGTSAEVRDAAVFAPEASPPASTGPASATPAVTAPGVTVPGFPSPGGAVSFGDLPLGYHLREGEHDLLAEDWEHFLAFCDRHLRG